jgi:hypothetical protein
MVAKVGRVTGRLLLAQDLVSQLTPRQSTASYVGASSHRKISLREARVPWTRSSGSWRRFGRTRVGSSTRDGQRAILLCRHLSLH